MNIRKCARAVRASAAACASGVMGAIGFAAAKATDPGAGATESFEAQQPILVGRCALRA